MASLGSKQLLFFLYVSMFMVTFSVGIYNPLIPLYAKILGATYTDLGIIGMVFAFPYAVLPVFVGSLTDRFGRKPFYMGGVLFSAITTILFVFASRVEDIILIRVFNGIAYSFLWPVAEPIIADITPPHERTKVMGRFSFSWALGFLLSPFFGGVIVENFGFHPLFITAMILGLGASLIAFYGLIYKQNNKFKKKDVLKEKKFNVKNNGIANSFNSLFSVYLVIVVYSIVVGIIFSIFPVYANSFGVTSFQIGMLFTIFGITRVIVFLNSENVSKIFGEKNSIILALIIQITSLTLMASVRSLLSFMFSMALLGLTVGIISPITLSLASKIARKGKVGATLGSMESLFGLGMTVGPLIGGIVAENVSIETPYIVAGLLSFLPLTILVKEKIRKT